MPLGMEVGLGPGDIVLDGDLLPLRKGDTAAPQFPRHFSADVYCEQTAGWIKMPLGTEIGLGPSHIVLEGIQPPKKEGHSPPHRFSAHVCCRHMAEWIKMPLGTKVGLVPGDTVLDGDPAPQRGTPPILGPCLLWPNDRPS